MNGVIIKLMFLNFSIFVSRNESTEVSELIVSYCCSVIFQSCVQAPVLPGPSGMQGMEVSQVPILQHGQIGMPGMDVQQTTKSQESFVTSRGSFLGNGQPRTLDFMGASQGGRESGMMVSPFQQGSFPPPIAEFTSAQLPLARLAEKSDSVMAHGNLYLKSSPKFSLFWDNHRLLRYIFFTDVF